MWLGSFGLALCEESMEGRTSLWAAGSVRCLWLRPALWDEGGCKEETTVDSTDSFEARAEVTRSQPHGTKCQLLGIKSSTAAVVKLTWEREINSSSSSCLYEKTRAT